MADTIPISQLASLSVDQVTNGDVFPITNADGDNNTYKLTLSNLDTFIKTSPSSSKVFVGTINNATFATSSATASFANTASFASGSGVTALTSSYARTSSISITAISAAYANVANTVLNPLAVTNVQTSSITYFLVYNPAAPNNGTASFSISSSNANSSSYATTASAANSASYAISASSANNANTANSSSFATTASYVKNAQITYITQALPIGSVMAFAATAIPTGWLECNGAILSQSSYQALYNVIYNNNSSAAFGYPCDVSGNYNPLLGTYFRLPDLRGEFIRGYDNGRGVDSGRIFGSDQNSSIAAHNHGIPGDDQLSNATGHGGWTSSYRGTFSYDAGSTLSGNGKIWNTTTEGGNDTYPKNLTMVYCIRYANLENYGTVTTASYIAGDVVGSLSASTVQKIQNQPIASTIPSNFNVLAYSSSQWQPTPVTAFPSFIKASARFSASWVNGAPSSPNAGDKIALDPLVSAYNISGISQISVGKFTITSSVVTTSSIVLLTSNYQEFSVHVSGSHNEGIRNGYIDVVSGRGSWTYSNIPFSIVVI
jgi:microcystin-dependent protein